jgi:hypothetical protein
MTRLGCWLLALAANLTIGAYAVNYALWGIFGKAIPWYAAAIAGLFLGEIAVPVAVIVWLLHFLVAFPIMRGA